MLDRHYTHYNTRHGAITNPNLLHKCLCPKGVGVIEVLLLIFSSNFDRRHYKDYIKV